MLRPPVKPKHNALHSLVPERSSALQHRFWLLTMQVYAAASEDMDTLTFRTPILLRHLTFSEQRKIPISEINLEKVLTGLDMSYEQVLSHPIEFLSVLTGSLSIYVFFWDAITVIQ